MRNVALSVFPLVPSIVAFYHIENPEVQRVYVVSVLVSLCGFLLTTTLVPVMAEYTAKKGLSGKDLGKRGTAQEDKQVPEALGLVAGTVFLVNAGLSGQDAVPYIARSLGLTAARLTAALATCESRFSFVCMHGDPPAGRPQIHRDCEVAIA